MADKDLKDLMEDGDFLDKDYEVPQGSGGYMKFELGENKFRILGKPIIGWEYWNDTDEGRKPLRFRMDEVIPLDELQEPEQGKHFWAMPVWNYKQEAVQILEITQKGIQKTIKELNKNPEWGKPYGYDISVVRSGEGLETKYDVIPSPPKPVAKDIVEIYDNMHINLEALFDGDDPFAE